MKIEKVTYNPHLVQNKITSSFVPNLIGECRFANKSFIEIPEDSTIEDIKKMVEDNEPGTIFHFKSSKVVIPPKDEISEIPQI